MLAFRNSESVDRVLRDELLLSVVEENENMKKKTTIRFLAYDVARHALNSCLGCV